MDPGNVADEAAKGASEAGEQVMKKQVSKAVTKQVTRWDKFLEKVDDEKSDLVQIGADMADSLLTKILDGEWIGVGADYDLALEQESNLDCDPLQFGLARLFC